MPGRTPIETVARLIAIVFLLVGILGFVPGVTTNLYDGLAFAGHSGTALLLGVFAVSVLHNIVHLLFGVVGLRLARSADTARTFLVGGGAIYLVLWIYGLAIDKESAANFVPVNSADDWLHFVLGVAMLGAGLVLARGAGPRAPAAG